MGTTVQEVFGVSNVEIGTSAIGQFHMFQGMIPWLRKSSNRSFFMGNSYKGIVHCHVYRKVSQPNLQCLDFWCSKFGNNLWLLAVFGIDPALPGCAVPRSCQPVGRGTNWSMGEMGASKRRSGRVKSKIMPGHVQFTVLSWSYPFEISLVPKKSCVVYPKIPWLSSFSRWKEVKESKYYKARMGRRGMV